jgi:hypothetical protein
MLHFLLTDFMHVHLQNGTWEGKIQSLHIFRRNTSFILSFILEILTNERLWILKCGEVVYSIPDSMLYGFEFFTLNWFYWNHNIRLNKNYGIVTAKYLAKVWKLFSYFMYCSKTLFQHETFLKSFHVADIEMIILESPKKYNIAISSIIHLHFP